ncbi:hypothetical protein B0H13DRAFT_2285274 [Mycena leptocephala]|nr:hypothetical protein B0H13DRAFT_2285274 [Mycena leptocephala]
MLTWGNESQTVNNYISGGVGGAGGTGNTQGHGGGGGTGEGPTQNYVFDAIENFTMNNLGLQIHDSNLYTVSGDVSLVIQNSQLHDSHHRLQVSSRSLELPPRINKEDLHHISTPFFRYQYESAPSNPQPTSPIRHPHAHDHAYLTDFMTLPSWNEEYIGARGQERQYHQIDPPQFIHGGTFITAQHVHQQQNVHQQHGEVGIYILSRGIALDALYNSAERFPQPRCHPDTRTELLTKLYHWVTDPSITRSIHWLHGPAGAGKSAVMQTLCEQLQDTGQICGSFFFKRGDQMRGNAKVLFATLAYQLAIRQHELKAMVSLNVEMDPSVLGRGMDVQLCTLIVEPCKWLQNNSPPVLLIDGLDECEGHHIQREIIHLIQSTMNGRFRGLRILVASRTEAHIKETFEEECFREVTDFTNIQQSLEDIRTYLHNEFLRIHCKHYTMKNIPTPWPTPQILEMLVGRSSGYFIYASTVIKFVDDEYSRPSKQLDSVVQNVVPHDSESPFATLDQLYMQILSRVPVQSHPMLCNILKLSSSWACPHWIEFITSFPPSADWVPLVQMVNLDFVLEYCGRDMYGGDQEETIGHFLVWLKEINPVPEALIQQWEDYRFVLQYEGFQPQIVNNLHAERYPESNSTDALAPSLSTIYLLHSGMMGEVQAIVTACRELLSHSPSLVRIFNAGRLLSPNVSYLGNPDHHSNQLFQIHIVLDLPWEDILGCICALRPLIPHKSVFFHTLFLFLPAICQELDHLYPAALVSRDLACGFLRLIQSIGRGERPVTWWTILYGGRNGQEWGRHIRSSPQPDPKLVQKLEHFVPPWDVFSQRWNNLDPVDFYDVVQWLKASPNPRPDLIDCWQQYLAENIVQKSKWSKWDEAPVDYSDHALEKRWQGHLKREASFYGPPREDMIRCWDRCLRKAREEDE